MKIIQISSVNAALAGLSNRLPRDEPVLIGRDEAIRLGVDALDPLDERSAGLSLIITGAAGVGKTTLAIRIAHLLIDKFADGQLMLRLGERTTSARGTASPTFAALLDLIDTDPPSATVSRSGQLSRIHALLGHRRILLVADDVTDEQQVRDLEEVGSSVTLVCTSRSRLSGLVEGERRWLRLGPLPDFDAACLLMATAGPGRVTEDQAYEIARLAGGLPLAIRIAAGRLRSRRHIAVVTYIDQLRHPSKGLKHWSAGDASVDAIIRDSFEALPSPMSELMQMFGALPAAPINVLALAAASSGSLDQVNDESIETTVELLDGLFERNLIEQYGPRHFGLHGILHRFCRHQSDSATDFRQRVIGIVCLAYAAAAQLAFQAVDSEDHNRLEALSPEVVAEIDLDRRAVLGCIQLACERAMMQESLTLAHHATFIFRHRGFWGDIWEMHHTTLGVARQIEHIGWEIFALRTLAESASHIGETREAVELLERAYRIANSNNHSRSACLSLTALATLMLNLGYPSEAIERLKLVLAGWDLNGDPQLHVETLTNLGVAYMTIAEWRIAKRYLDNAVRLADKRSVTVPEVARRALARLYSATGHPNLARQEAAETLRIAQLAGNRGAEGLALITVGQYEDESGNTLAARDYMVQAAEIFRAIGDIPFLCRSLEHLGEYSQKLGESPAAIECFIECRDLARSIGDAMRDTMSSLNLAGIFSGIGQVGRVEEFLSEAKESADSSKSFVLVMRVKASQADYLLENGNAHEAEPLLREILDSPELFLHREEECLYLIHLAEALLRQNQLAEAENEIQRALRAVTVTDAPRVHMLGHRSLATILSRSDLFDEALESARISVALANDVASDGDRMECHAALATTLARMGNWVEALAEYEVAIPIAGKLKSFRRLTAYKANAASCRNFLGDSAASIDELKSLLENAKLLNMPELEAVSHSNIGAWLAENNRADEAVPHFEQALRLARSGKDVHLQATCLKHLAKVSGAPYAQSAVGLARQAREAFESLRDWKSAAQVLPLELPVNLALEDPFGQFWSSLEALGARKGTIAAFRSLFLVDDTADVNAKSSRRRRIQVSEEVRGAMNLPEIGEIIDRMETSRQSCFACHLPVSLVGTANLILQLSPCDDGLVLRLAHNRCAQSMVIVDPELEIDKSVRMEIECAIQGDDPSLAQIVVDSYGGFGAVEGQGVTDVWLDSLKSAGFFDVRDFGSLGQRQFRIDETLIHSAANGLSAILNGDKVTVAAKGLEFISNAPLSFISDWYQACRTGILIIMIGRNLTGMSWEDPANLLRAAEKGKLVMSVVPLKVVPPPQNSTCVCTPSYGTKFKHCCGRTR
ncbi:NB-ARC domain-containing protein [Longispora urticae]